MNRPEELELVFQLCLNGWVILVALGAASAFYLPAGMTAGVILGALLVAINLSLLYRAVKRSLNSEIKVSPKKVLPGFYLCFLATVVIVSILITQQVVDRLGLLMGLGVFALDVFIVVAQQAGRIVYRTITKEAV